MDAPRAAGAGPEARERIVTAAVALLAYGGRAALTTRAVAAGAAVAGHDFMSYLRRSDCNLDPPRLEQQDSTPGRTTSLRHASIATVTPGCAIAVMGKVPRAGRSKTRLGAIIGAHAAAALSGAFLRDTTDNVALAAREAPILGYVAYAPAGEEQELRSYMAPGTELLLADGAGPMPDGVDGFGRSLFGAVRDLLAAGHDSACVLNSDGPTLPTAFLVRTAALLAEPGDRAVLGPAEDGGYYVLGLKRPHACLFRDIAWSTAGVADATRARAACLGLDLVELPPWYDVDDVASLGRLSAALADPVHPGFASPATRACLDRLGLAATLPRPPAACS
ncbi:TIGR04282 family arsenosugar biosynthesis glycosyltransferase [Lichenicoccus sp.]|uniref:TIGR04282 family arsenosugar biosynthesis glycosyltransferase n=1 Tax=Lichenicoccus sp. TaxID=2781899 RepID=UPI003D0D09CA